MLRAGVSVRLRRDAVQEVGKSVGEGEHRPMTRCKLVKLPLRVRENSGAGITLRDEVTQEREADAAAGAEDRGAPNLRRPILGEMERRREGRIRLRGPAFLEQGEVL